MNVRTLVLALMALLAQPAAPQGFAGLGSDAEGFALPSPDHVLSFPEDHFAHPTFRIEWWYLTANLTDEDGQDYGLQWTLFRSALAPETAEGWSDPQIWFAHAAVTTPDHHYHAERLARGGVGQAGVDNAPFRAFIDDWALTGINTTGDLLDDVTLTASGDGFSYDMRLTAQGPLVFQGDDGYSVKSSDGQASHYYSQPFYEITGMLELPGGSVEVTGQAWLDREWSSQPLSDDQNGWDWFSLHLDDGTKLMGFGLRSTRGDHFTSATWIDPAGETEPYGNGALELTPLETSRVAERDIPTRWRLRLKDRGLDLEIAAVNPQAWMGTNIAYWEGPVRVTGSHQGRGYLEMTGYE